MPLLLQKYQGGRDQSVKIIEAKGWSLYCLYTAIKFYSLKQTIFTARRLAVAFKKHTLQL